MTKRKYRTDEEWLSLIQECRLSGLTDKQWCEAHQICPSNFYYQIQKFRKRACEIPESSKTTLTAQKQEVVQVTFVFCRGQALDASLHVVWTKDIPSPHVLKLYFALTFAHVILISPFLHPYMKIIKSCTIPADKTTT